MRARSPWAAGAILVALGAMVWLLFGDVVFDEADTAHTETIASDLGPSDAMEAESEGTVEHHPSLAARPRPTRDPSAGRGGVDVLAVNPAGVPLPGVRLELRGPPPVASEAAEGEPASGDAVAAGNPVRFLITDARGRAYFPDVPYDGTWRVGAPDANNIFRTVPHLASVFLRLSGKPAGGAGNAGVMGKQIEVLKQLDSLHGAVVIKGQAARLELNLGLPLRFVGFEGTTGAELARAPWAATPQVGHSGKPKRRSLPVQTVRTRPGETTRFHLHVPDHAGLVPNRQRAFQRWVSPLARELRAHFPQHPLAELMVELPEGTPLTSAADWKVRFSVDGRTHGTATAAIDGFGRVSLRGVPFLAGQQVVVKGPIGKLGHLSARGVFGMDARDPLVLEGKWRGTPADVYAAKRGASKALIAARQAAELTTRLDFLKSAQQELSVQVQELAGGRLIVQLVGPGGVPIPSHDEEAKAPEQDKAYVRVRVRRADGAPAQAARVHIGAVSKRLDARGRALIGPLEPGEFQVHVHGAGAVFHSTVSLVAGETQSLELDAGKGGEIDVLVVDGEGHALPFAEVTLVQPSGLAYADIEQGAQRLDPFVDHTGRRRFHGVEVGEVTVEARYGSRVLAIKVQVQAGGTVSARLVLVRQKPKSAPVGVEDARKKLGRALDQLKEIEAARRQMQERGAGGK